MTFRLSAALVLILALLCSLQVGCASAPPPRTAIPSYQWTTPQQAIDLANQRATSLDTIFAAGDLILDVPASQNTQGKQIKARKVKLQMAMVVMGDKHLRLRAWQSKKPVLDITLNPDGMWRWIAPDAIQLPVSNVLLRKLPAMLRGDVAVKTSVLNDSSPWLTFQEAFPKDGRPVRYMMHKPTLTIRRFEFIDKKQHVAEAVNLEDYDLVDMYPWPRRLLASSDQGNMRLDLTEVQLNSRLPDQAFVPYSQATKQP